MKFKKLLIAIFFLVTSVGCRHEYSWDRGYPSQKTNSKEIEDIVQQFEIVKIVENKVEFRPINGNAEKIYYSRISLDPMLKRISPKAFELIQKADLKTRDSKVANSLYFQASTYVISPGWPPWISKARDVAIYGTLAYIIYQGRKIQDIYDAATTEYNQSLRQFVGAN